MKKLLALLSTLISTMIVTPVFAQPGTCPPAASHISIQSGTYASKPGITFHLRNFNATLVPIGKTAPACYQKMTVVSRAEIFVSNESLTQVFAEKLGGGESKIKGFKVENGIGKVTLSGRITKIVPIEFTIEGPVTTDGTSILLDAGKIKADGIPLKALLTMVGEHLNNVLGLKNIPGISVDDNRLSFFPEQIAHLKGHIESVVTSPQGLTLRYADTTAHRQTSGT